jgi:hypothetical protein
VQRGLRRTGSCEPVWLFNARGGLLGQQGPLGRCCSLLLGFHPRRSLGLVALSLGQQGLTLGAGISLLPNAELGGGLHYTSASDAGPATAAGGQALVGFDGLIHTTGAAGLR